MATPSPPSAPDPPAARSHDEVLVAIVGIVAWAVALVVLAVFFRHDLQRHHSSWWLWACALGLVLGLYGLRFAHRRRAG
jgi:RsiW-degrading membrane proteinase PrsW (M82 family)